MVSARRSNRNMTLVANDEFWHAPTPDQDVPSTSDDSMELYLPQAHRQLLAENELPSRTNLKGYDHRRPVVSFDSFDDFGFEATDLDTSFFSGQNKLSHVKKQGGGSWLLGFARMRDESTTTEEEDTAPPGLVRLESDDSSDTSDDESTATSPSPSRKSKGVSFSESVTVQPIPHSSNLSSMQRRKMYTSTMEVRQNKIRNKKEYRYDGCDWRNATEEWQMGVDVVTGELVHPAHDEFCDNISWS